MTRDANPFWSQSWRKIFKGVPKDSFRNLNIFSLKSIGETKVKILNLQLWPYLKAGVMVSKLETWHPYK
jgi:hypothetical protein